jgi:hypothetical protein
MIILNRYRLYRLGIINQAKNVGTSDIRSMAAIGWWTKGPKSGPAMAVAAGPSEPPLGFQLTDFDKKPSLKRYSAFHGVYKRLRILLVVRLLCYKYSLAINSDEAF